MKLQPLQTLLSIRCGALIKYSVQAQLGRAEQAARRAARRIRHPQLQRLPRRVLCPACTAPGDITVAEVVMEVDALLSMNALSAESFSSCCTGAHGMRGQRAVYQFR